jgi:hypothetical protein
VTRTNKAVTRFEPVQSLRTPSGVASYVRLEGEGSGGPLDLFADLGFFKNSNDGSYHQQVRPLLSLVATKRTLRRGKLQVTVRVLDAGDPISGARVTGLPGGAKTTNARGIVIATLARRTIKLTAAKSGYVGARRRLVL